MAGVRSGAVARRIQNGWRSHGGERCQPHAPARCSGLHRCANRRRGCVTPVIASRIRSRIPVTAGSTNIPRAVSPSSAGARYRTISSTSVDSSSAPGKRGSTLGVDLVDAALGQLGHEGIERDSAPHVRQRDNFRVGAGADERRLLRRAWAVAMRTRPGAENIRAAAGVRRPESAITRSAVRGIAHPPSGRRGGGRRPARSRFRSRPRPPARGADVRRSGPPRR